MVKDSNTKQAGDASAADPSASVLETSTPSVPSFESLQSDEQTAFRLSYDLLRHNLENLSLPAEATAEAEEEAAAASRRLLGDNPAVQSLLETPAGSQLSNNRFGREMLRLAEEFRASRQGTEADRIAREVRLEDLDSRSFTDILERLFYRGYNVESFVTLFHFVARLLQRAYSERGEPGFRTLCHQVMTAFLLYLVVNVIKFLANLFRALSQERQVAAVSFVSGLAIAFSVCAVIYMVARRTAGGGGN